MLTAGLSEEGLRPMREAMAGHVELGALCGDSARWPSASRSGQGTSTAPWQAARMLSSGYGSGTSRSPAAHRGPCRHRAVALAVGVAVAPGSTGGAPKAGTSAHAASTATSQPAPPTSPATATASAPTATQALATFAGDVTLIRRDRRGHRPRYRPDHFHPGCQGPAIGGHGDRPRTHGMENGSFEQPGGSVLRADLSALAA